MRKLCPFGDKTLKWDYNSANLCLIIVMLPIKQEYVIILIRIGSMQVKKQIVTAYSIAKPSFVIWMGFSLIFCTSDTKMAFL